MEGDAPASIERIPLTLVDESRPTPANNDYPGAPHRTLVTDVSYVPTGDAVPAPRPLVVFATGYGGTTTNWAGLYDHWVRAGYVVAAPAFPLSQRDAPGGTTGADFDSQAGDLRFVTAQVLRLATTPGSELHGRVVVDPDRVALAGKSFGAITVFEAGYNPEELVPGIRAVIAMTGVATKGPQFERVGTPLLLAHGDQDALVAIAGSQDVYHRAQPPKFFVTLFGADHLSAFHGGTSAAEDVVVRATTAFLDHYVNGDADALSRLWSTGDEPDVASIEASV
ncbi:MAG TPA: hypothetical protein VEP49_16220 [Acidimicrobiia bacterium]|nr:hypothetical protein [Acidimicrobiia bacterium]